MRLPIWLRWEPSKALNRTKTQLILRFVKSPHRARKRPLRECAGVPPVARGTRRNAVEQTSASLTTTRGSRTRERLKEAAAEGLERMGYRAMRLTDVAGAADVNVSLCYHYFSSKPDITRETQNELLDSRVARGTQARSPANDPFDTIVNANPTTVETYAATPGLMRCLLHIDEDETALSKLYRRVGLD